MAANIEYWVKESLRRGEKVVVIIRNETTREEVETEMNPRFVAELVIEGEIMKRGGE